MLEWKGHLCPGTDSAYDAEGLIAREETRTTESVVRATCSGLTGVEIRPWLWLSARERFVPLGASAE
jgi:hypothetical protein